MSAIGEAVRQGLQANKDDKYKAFTCALVPTVAPERVIGVRSPAVRQLSRELLRRSDALNYLEELPHHYLEENLVHCRFLESLREYPALVRELDRFLPCVDNWAVCDSLNPRLLHRKANRSHLKEQLRVWMGNQHPYTVRFSILMLMRCFLDEESFCVDCLDWVAELDREEYYVRMMQAWFFAEALTKQYDAAILYLMEHRLSVWVHNKAIQKAIESRRISAERKTALKALRRSAGRG